MDLQVRIVILNHLLLTCITFSTYVGSFVMYCLTESKDIHRRQLQNQIKD